MSGRAIRQLVSLNALVLTWLFAVPALEALLLRREVTLLSRAPFVVLALAYALAGSIVYRLDTRAERSPGLTWAVAASSFFLLLVGSYFARMLLDTSWDGITYHQPAIYELRTGWNPYTRALDVALSSNNLFINEYPRSAWYASAVLLGVFGDIEAAKLSFFLGVSVFLAALRVLALYQVPGRVRGAVTALLLVLNPVVIVQLWQFYIDGVMYYSLLLCLLAALAYARERDRLDLVSLVAMGVFIANLKFTGVIYFGAIFGWLAADQLLWSRSPQAWRALLMALGSWLVLAASTGFNPYLTHLLGGRHLFYPVMGVDAIDIVTPHIPAGLVPYGWAGRLVASHAVFLQGDFSWLRLAQELSLLGSGTIGDVGVDPRELGLGRYFWLAYLLIHVPALFAILRARSLRLAFAVACLLVFSVLNPVAWWARYVPQLWAAPIIMGTITVAVWPRLRVWLPVAGAFYLLALSAQLYLGQSWALQLLLSNDVTARRAALVPQLENAAKIRVSVIQFAAHYYWLQRQGLPIERLAPAQLHCPAPISAMTLTLCVEPKSVP